MSEEVKVNRGTAMVTGRQIYTVPRGLNTAYDQGVEDGIRQERERIREALLSDGAVKAVDGIWKFPTKGMERTNRMRLAAALDHIGLGAVEEGEE